MTDVLDELKWRGLVALSTDEDALRAHLAAGPVTFYVGFDPTAPSLHFGNLVQLMVARHLQAAGHHPLILVGGSTGLIGDPKESAERVLNPKEVVAEWVGRIRQQVERFVDFTGDNPARIVNNLDWTGSVSVLDFLRDIGKHFPVNRMLARDVVRNRLEEGISYTEFSYVLLQSFDYLELFRTYGCTLQTGGSDQWGNITAGVELIRRAEGARVHALATPLLTKADGTKFGKTESGTVWLDSGDDLAVRVPPGLPERRGREGHRVPQGVQPAEPGRDRRAGPPDGRAAAPAGRAEGAGRRRDRPGALAGRARGGRRRGVGAVRPRPRWTTWTPDTLAGVVAEVGGVELPGTGTEVSVVDLLERSGVVAEPRRGAPGDRRGRGLPEQPPGHRSGGGARAATTCCTAATRSCGGARRRSVRWRLTSLPSDA